MSHTKAPWKIGLAVSLNNALAIFEQKAEPGMNPKDFRTICLVSPAESVDDEDIANARRIVTCVNEFDKWKGENAQLLEALKEIYDECFAVSSPSIGTMEKASAAIEKATNGTHCGDNIQPATAGEKIEAGDFVYISEDGKALKSDRTKIDNH